MAQTQTTETSTQRIGDAGEIRISADALRALRLAAGDDLVEFVIDGALVYVPVEAVFEQTVTRLQQSLAARGLTTEDLLGDLDAAREEVFAEMYPNLAKSTGDA